MRSRRRHRHGRQHRVRRQWPDAFDRRGRRAGHARKGIAREPGRSRSSPRVRIEGRGLRHRRRSEEEPANSNSPLPCEPQQSVEPPERTKVSLARRTAGSRSVLVVPTKPEKRSPRDPVEGRETPGQGTAEGKHEQDFELDASVNETSADSRAGEENAGSGTEHALPPHRPRVSARGLSTNPQGRSNRRRRHDGERVCEQTR